MSPSSATSWEVKARAHHCTATGDAFVDGQTLVSRLRATDEGLVREDFAETAWDESQQQASRFHWKTTYHPPAPKSPVALREDNALEALKELMEENDPANTRTLFILAALLERKRIWVERAVQQDDEGRKIRIYEQKDSGETFLIVDPEVALEELADLQQEVALKLGWIKPEEPEADAEEAAEDPEASGDEGTAPETEAGDEPETNGTPGE